MAKIGVSGFRYALQTADTPSTLTYGAPVLVPGVIAINIKSGKSITTLSADNGPYETASALGDIEIEIDLADLKIEDKAALAGHTITNGVLKAHANDVAPYVAVGFESLKANGKKQWVWLLKGTFAEPDNNNKSKGETVEFQTQKLAGKFVITAKNGQWHQMTDEDAIGYVEGSGATFIATVPTT